MLTQQVRVGILAMDLGCYSGPRHFCFLFAIDTHFILSLTHASNPFRVHLGR